MSTTTITFGDVAENHAGMQRIVAKPLSSRKRASSLSVQKIEASGCKEGFTLKELTTAKKRFEKYGYECTLYHLNDALNVEEEVEDAYVLRVRRGLECLLNFKRFLGEKSPEYDIEDMKREHGTLDVDKKAFMRGRVVNKHARYNLCFANRSQEPNYEEGKGRVVAFKDVPVTKEVRTMLPSFFGWKALQLVAEGNYYYDVKRCFIGWHGDGERKLVIAVRLGKRMPLYFRWYHRNQGVSERVEIQLDDGDVYCMSSKAVGTDWKRSSIYTLRHATGCEKYIR